MSQVLSQFREQNPAYKDWSDEELSNGLYEKYYSDMDKGDYLTQIGLEAPSTDGVNNPGEVGSLANIATGSLISATGQAGKYISQSLTDFGKGFSPNDMIAKATGKPIAKDNNDYVNKALDPVVDYGQRMTSNVSPEYKDAMAKRFFDKDNNIQSENSAWSDPRAIIGTTASGVAQFIPSAIATLVTKNPMAGAAIAASMEGGNARQNVYDTVMKLDDKALETSPMYQDLISQNIPKEEAKKKLAYDLSKAAGDQTAIASGALEYIGGKYLLDGIFGDITGSVAKKLGVQVLAQGGTEGFQGASQQGIQNYNVKKADDSVNITDDLANNATQEAIGGLGIAGVVGGYDSIKNRNQPDNKQENLTNKQAIETNKENSILQNELDNVEQEAVGNPVSANSQTEQEVQANSQVNNGITGFAQQGSIEQRVKAAQKQAETDRLNQIDQNILQKQLEQTPEYKYANGLVSMGTKSPAELSYQLQDKQNNVDKYYENKALIDNAIIPGKDLNLEPVKNDELDALSEKYRKAEQLGNMPNYKFADGDTQSQSKQAQFLDTNEPVARFAPDENADFKTPANLNDERLKDTNYRTSIKILADELVENGGVSVIPDPKYVRGESDSGAVPQVRTKSLNPSWFKDGNFTYTNVKGNESVPSVKQVKVSVDKALQGKPLSKTESSIVKSLMDISENDVAQMKQEFTPPAITPSDVNKDLDKESIQQYFNSMPERPSGEQFAPTMQEVEKAVTKQEQGKLMSKSEQSIVANLNDQAWQSRNPKGNGRSNGMRDVLNMQMQESKDRANYININGYKVKSTIPVVDEIAKKLGADVNIEGDYINKPDPYAMGDSTVLKFSDANVQLSTRLIDNRLELTGINVKTPSDMAVVAKGTGRGTQIIKALNDYANKNNLEFTVIDSTNNAKKYYESLPFLKQSRVETMFDGKPYTPPISFVSKNKFQETKSLNNNEQVQKPAEILNKTAKPIENVQDNVQVSKGLKQPAALANNSVFKTKSGRETTVSPRFDDQNKVLSWLFENAKKEAVANGDEMASIRFGGMGAWRAKGDDISAASEYLFGRKYWTEIGDLATKKNIKVAQSGQPFKSEKTARLSKTFKSLVNGEVVPVDGGFGVREVKPEKNVTESSKTFKSQKNVKKEPTYISRPVLNADEIIAWAKEQGFNKTLSADDMHVTVVYSREPVAIKPISGDVSITDSKRTVESLGEDGAVVLKFESKELQGEWKSARDAGASWDYESYTPHVTITYDGGDIDTKSIKPFTGEIKLGSQVVEALNEDAVSTYKEVKTTTNQEPKTAQIQALTDKTPVNTVKESRTSQENSDSAKNATTGKNVNKIDDFGEKLEGAKKFKQELSKTLDEDMDVRSMPLSKSFPKPDTQKMIDNGVNKKVIAFVLTLRNQIKAKPRKGYKLDRWVKQVELARELSSNLLQVEPANVDKVLNSYVDEVNVGKFIRSVNVADQLNTANEIEALANSEIGKISGQVSKENIGDLDTAESSNRYKEGVFKSVNKGDLPTLTGDFYKVSGKYFADLDNAQAYLVASLIGTEKKAAKTKFISWSMRNNPGEHFVGKQVGKNYITLASGFKSSAEARNYIKQNQEQLEKDLIAKKDVPPERIQVAGERIGEDYRNGKDITPEEFTQAFGFRGVQFGNWVENKKRQNDLNEAYDGLMDLAGVLDIPPRAISLDGQLGLAFGARGSKGAKAHYEPGKVVINLTKNDGAGSLAHEWLHALDNYFGKMDADLTDNTVDSPFATEQRRPTWKGVTQDGKYVRKDLTGDDFNMREAVYNAWVNLTDTIKDTELYTRSLELDGLRSKPYWATEKEMAARSFDDYIISKLQEKGYSSDYLASPQKLDGWAVLTDKPYPFPVGEEATLIRKAFDNLFKTIETKETENGNVAMFSRKDSDTVNANTEIEIDQNEQDAIRTLRESINQYRGDENNSYQESDIGLPDNIRTALEEGFGRKIIGFKTKSGYDFNGVVLPNDQKVIYVNSEADKPVMAIAGHEFMHGLRKDNPELYNVALHAIGNIVGDANYDKYVDNFNAKTDANGEARQPEQLIAEELMADILGDNFNRPEFWAKVSERMDGDKPGTFNKLMKSLKAFLSRLSNLLSPLGSNKYLTDVKAAQDVMADITTLHMKSRMGNKKAQAEMSQLAPVFSERGRLEKVEQDYPVIEITESAFSEFDNIKDKANSTILKARELFQGKSYVVYDTGIKVNVTRKGIEHTANKSSSTLLNSLLHLDQIIEQSKFIESESPKPYEKDKMVVKVDFYGARVVENGVEHNLVTVVKERADGYKYYDHYLEKKNKALETPMSSQVNSYLNIDSNENNGNVKFSRKELDKEGNELLAQWSNWKEAKAKGYDKFERLKDLQKALKKIIGDTAPNIYDAAQRYLAITPAKLKDFRFSIDSLIKGMEKSNISDKDLGLYLYAKHAPERNAYILNKNGVENGSGMTDEAASEIVKELSDKFPDIEEQALKVRAMLDRSLDERVAAGTVASDARDLWRKEMPNYVPLKNEIDTRDELNTGDGEISVTPQNGFLGTGQRFNLTGREIIKAEGRQSLAGDILSNAIYDIQRGIVRGEKNKVNRMLAEAIESYPQDSLWSIREPDGKLGQNDIHFFENGEKKYIEINDSKLLESMKGLDDEPFAVVDKLITYVKRTITAWNPAFTIVNSARDSQMAVVNGTQELGAKGAKDMAKYVADAASASYRYERQSEAKNDKQKEWDNWHKLYRLSGGMTGYVGLDSLQELQADFESRFKKHQSGILSRIKGKARPVGNSLYKWMGLEFFEDLGTATENMWRLAAFRVAMEQGKSRNEAAKIAKNLTVNFDRKGTQARNMDRYFLFYNAAMQGVVRMGQTLNSPKRVMAVTGSLMALGFLAGMQGDEDEYGNNRFDMLPEYEKQRGIPIFLGEDGTRFVIPMSYGLGFFTHMGMKVAQLVRNQQTNGRNGITVPDALEDSFNSLGMHFMPLGGTEFTGAVSGENDMWLQLISPFFIDPVVKIQTNKNGFGGSLYPENPFNKDDVPDSEKVFNYQKGTIYDELAKGMSRATGGDGITKGSIEVAPATIETWARFFTGGIGRFYEQMASLAMNGVEDDFGEVEPRKIPVVSTVLKKGSDKVYYDAYKEVRDDLSSFKSKMQDYAISGNKEKVAEMRSDYRTRLIGANDGTIKAISNLRKAIKSERARLNKEESESRKKLIKLKIKNLEKKQSELQAKLIERAGEQKAK